MHWCSCTLLRKDFTYYKIPTNLPHECCLKFQGVFVSCTCFCDKDLWGFNVVGWTMRMGVWCPHFFPIFCPFPLGILKFFIILVACYKFLPHATTLDILVTHGRLLMYSTLLHMFLKYQLHTGYVVTKLNVPLLLLIK